MIVSVYGKVDNSNVIFCKSDNGWACTVPADLEDGQYACSFIAESDYGAVGYWTGILYVTDGSVLCPRLVEDDIVIWLLPESNEWRK